MYDTLGYVRHVGSCRTCRVMSEISGFVGHIGLCPVISDHSSYLQGIPTKIPGHHSPPEE